GTLGSETLPPFGSPRAQDARSASLITSKPPAKGSLITPRPCKRSLTSIRLTTPLMILRFVSWVLEGLDARLHSLSALCSRWSQSSRLKTELKRLGLSSHAAGLTEKSAKEDSMP